VCGDTQNPAILDTKHVFDDFRMVFCVVDGRKLLISGRGTGREAAFFRANHAGASVVHSAGYGGV
jgi:hypothetical protein